MEEIMMKTLLFATAIGCALAGGCATNPDNIAPTALSPVVVQRVQLRGNRRGD